MKFLQKIYNIELKMRETLGTRFTYLLIVFLRDENNKLVSANMGVIA